jgi:hypothetical protein
MEEILWVQTPPCRLCVPRREYARRPGCIGCEKLRPARPARRKVSKAPARPRLSAGEAKRRAARAAELRTRGLSLGEIAAALALPRSTVQGILGRAARG